MSLKEPDRTRMESGFNQGDPVRHRLVICAGYDADHPAEQGHLYTRTTYVDDEGERHLNGVAQVAADLSTHHPYTINGTLDNRGRTTVVKVLEFLRGWRDHHDQLVHDGWFDPRGKIVLFGYSAGGFNVVSVTQAINRWWYRYGSGGQRGSLETELPFDQAAGAQVLVDLLVTIDPCVVLLYGEGWPGSRWVPPCVVAARNWYQRIDPQFKGVMLSGRIPRMNRPPVTWNSVTSSSEVRHVDMVEITRPWAVPLMRQILPAE